MEEAKSLDSILIMSGGFLPLHEGHIRRLTFCRESLEASLNTRIVKAYIVPLNESAIRKRFNGGAPIDDDERIETIKK